MNALDSRHALSAHLLDAKGIVWVMLAVLLALLVSAFAGLQLFQDGSSYLLEMLIDHSAVRHGRLSALLFQYPTILLIKAFHRLEIDPLVTLPIVRLAFNLNYALTPFIALALSWLIVRRKREELLIWATLIILFVNLVNFSWVSELLISVQLACPLLLGLLQNPESKRFRLLFLVLTPFIFFLHPLVITVYLVLAGASGYVAYQRPVYRRAARLSAILFLVAAATRATYTFFTLSLYEVSFTASGEIGDYFVLSRLENILFLATAVEIAFLVLLAQSKWGFMRAMSWLVALQSYVLLYFAARLLLGSNALPWVLVSCLGIPAIIRFWPSRPRLAQANPHLLYLACAFLAASAGCLLLAQYVLPERLFTLKMGSDLFVSLLIMGLAAIDSGRALIPSEYLWRSRLVIALGGIFVCVILAKAAMWQTSVQRLEQTLRHADDACLEMTSSEFGWLQNSPYTIIHNWSLPSLALVIQD
ncbi:MAG: hypothetical protein M3Y68_16105, partial [Chloroflexota bacterium]|nr:hypothetical protein [Chloroflexota bacterium]